MKKIAVVSNGLSGGGAERVASIVANYFDNKGYSVLFVAAYSPDREYVINDSIKYEYVSIKSKKHAFRLVERSLKMKKIISSFGADTVFSFILPELIPIALSKIRLVPSLRIDPKATEGDKVKAWIRKFVFRHSDAIVFQTEDARDYFEEKIRKKGVIIYNPIKSDLPYWDENNHNNHFIAACRISKQKNIPMMINAFKRFHQLYPDYVLDIYGDGDPADYRGKMEEYASQCGVNDYVHFLGHSKDIHTIMTQSQALLLSSDYEGLSNSMLEAMAIGLPVICTDCPPGGARAFINNNESGLLVPVGGEDEMVDALCKLVKNTELQHTISHNSRFVRDMLNKDEICAKWENLL